MKKAAFGFLALAFFGLSANQASARSIRPFFYESQITQSQIDAQLGFGGSELAESTISYYPMSRELALNLKEKVPCNDDGVCLAVMPRVLNAKLRIINEFRTECGSQVLIAESDLRPVDGIRQALTVIDNTGNTCPHFAPLAPVEAIYETQGYSQFDGFERRTYSRFSGDTFVVKSLR